MKQCGLSFDGSLTTLGSIIKSMGFKWKKTADKRKVLMESHEIRYKRITYLKQLMQYKREGRPIIYTDESYIHGSHTEPYEWSDGSSAGLKKPIGKGKRLIIVHAGGANGFIPNALLMFPSGTKSGDFHDDMNATNFLNWVKKQLLPNLPPRSVLVVDNASYHNTTLDKHPTSGSLKKDMIQWLTERNIQHDAGLTKPELYELIKIHKPRHQRYELDTLLHEHGHSVLRLPPYHPDLNPIEKIWANVKNWVAARNVTFKLEDVKALALERFQSISKDEWVQVCKHADNIANAYMEKIHTLEDAFETLVFTVNTGESDDSQESGVEPLSDDDN